MEMKIHPMEIKTDANKAPKTPLSALFAPLQIVTKSGRFNILPNAVTPLPRPTGGRRKKTRLAVQDFAPGPIIQGRQTHLNPIRL